MYALDHRSTQNQSRSIRTALRRRSIPHCLRVFSQPCSSQPQRNNRQEKTSNNRKLWNKIWHINSWQSCQTVRLSLTFIVYCWNVLLASRRVDYDEFPSAPFAQCTLARYLSLLSYACSGTLQQERIQRAAKKRMAQREWKLLSPRRELRRQPWVFSVQVSVNGS